MTETEWLASTDPKNMLAFLCGKTSDRKLRLFACACCRHIWQMLTDERSRKAVDVAERYADGEVSNEEMATVQAEAWAAAQRGRHRGLPIHASSVAECAAAAARDTAAVGMQFTLFPPPTDAEYAAIMASDNAYAAQGSCDSRCFGEKAQADLLCDIFGNPFTALPAINLSWTAWNNGSISKLAQSIYDQRAFDRLPILAEALEKAGCNKADILNHCRKPGE